MAGDEAAPKTVLVTGATSGIGRIVAQDLARRGMRVVVVGRDPARLQAVMKALPPPSRGAHAAHQADLSSLSEMRRLAADILASEPVIDVLINNAGALFSERAVTVDGWERTFALNHMAYVVVTMGLLDRVKAAPAGRIVVTASRMHGMSSLDFDDLQAERRYSGYLAYSRSKLCNVLFALTLARRLEGSGVTCNALHPGFVATRFGDDASLLGRLNKLAKVFAISPTEGAKTTLHVATSAEGGRLNGAYFVKCQPTAPSPAARRDADGERLWAMTDQLLSEASGEPWEDGSPRS